MKYFEELDTLPFADCMGVEVSYFSIIVKMNRINSLTQLDNCFINY